MKQIDFSAINSALLADISARLLNWLPDGIREAHEYVALNPTRADKKRGSFRINVNTGMWADFATGDKGGDLISLYAYLHGKSDQAWAAKELAPTVGITTEAVDRKKDVWAPIFPVPEGIEFKQPYYKNSTASAIWLYHSINGELLGAVARFNTTKTDHETNEVVHGKDVIPATYCMNTETGAKAWRWKGFNTPRPLYGQERISKQPKANIIVVEGEKTADAAQKLFPAQVIVTWPGGGKGVKYADWTALHGRKVILWPDNDAPGFSAMRELAALLQGKVEKITYILPPKDAQQGWDVADADWTSAQAIDFVKQSLANALPVVSLVSQQELPIPSKNDAKGEFEADKDTGYKEVGQNKNQPFRALGFDKSYFYYMTAGTRTILALSLAQHNKAHMLGLAPLHYWEREFPDRGGADWDAAQNFLLRLCESVGFFSPALIRGRGAWYDDGRIIIHLGNKVLIDTQAHQPDKVPSNYYYEAGLKMSVDLDSPLSNEDATKFATLLEMLPWDKAIDARLVAGWCVCAHIGGALNWRPHLWTIGRKGSGKTHVMSHIVKPILGDNCFFIQADSTGAGIRQNLGKDSLPVLFDEAEGENEQALSRMQGILQLVRQSSSDTGGIIAKGTPTGKAQNFDIRSCFAFSSINATIMQSSDKSRVTVVELNQEKSHTIYEDLLKAEAALLTKDYIKRFYARSLTLAKTIRRNAEIFAKVMAGVFGEQRAGDQIGTLLAGAYSLFSHDVISYDDAKEWVERQDWKERRDEVSGQNDEKALWAFLLQQKLRAKVSGGDEDFPIGYLIEIARGSGYLLPDVVKPDADKSRDILMRNGIKTESDHIFVSNTSPHIQKMLRDTPWSVNWSRTLNRLPNASPSEDTIYFGYRGSEARAIKVMF